MKNFSPQPSRLSSLSRLCVTGIVLVIAWPATAGPPTHWNRDNPDQSDSGEGLYSIPYQKPTRAEITAVLDRVRGFLDLASPTRVIDRETGATISAPTRHVATAAIASGRGTFNPFSYEMGVVHAGMLRAHEVTGMPAFRDFTERHVQFIHDWRPYFVELEKRFQLKRNNAFHRAIDPRSLDDSGSLCAALIRAARVGTLVAGRGEEAQPIVEEGVGVLDAADGVNASLLGLLAVAGERGHDNRWACFRGI